MMWGDVAFSEDRAVIFASDGMAVVSRGGGPVAIKALNVSEDAVRSIIRYRGGGPERIFANIGGVFYSPDPESGELVRKDPPLRIRVEQPEVRLRVVGSSELAMRMGEKPVCHFVVSAEDGEAYISCLCAETHWGSTIRTYVRVLLWKEGAGLVVLEPNMSPGIDFPPIDLARKTFAVVWGRKPWVNMAYRGALSAIRGIERYGDATSCTLSEDAQTLACVVRDPAKERLQAILVDLSWLEVQPTPPPADRLSVRAFRLRLPEDLAGLPPWRIRPLRIAPTLDWAVVEIKDANGRNRSFAPAEISRD